MNAARLRHWRERALHWRTRLIPDSHALGWTPVYWLFYLGFLFIPALFGWLETGELLLTIATIPPFLWLYFRVYGRSGWATLPSVLGIAALAYVLVPVNTFANTYMIYVAGCVPLIGRLPLALGVYGALLGVFALETWLLGQHMLGAFVAGVVGAAVCAANHQMLQKHRKDAELRLSHEEIRRLAQVAERERIGRDLHDLLGHTLSLIALKSELARKLIDRDPVTAGAEIVEVERVARDALSQVRRAVTGIRSAALKPELASARLLLDGAGVEFRYSLAELPLSAAQETCLALVLREAITNVHRHARAQRVEASLRRDGDEAVLTVIDDGRGGAGEPGNGLRGMEERVRALGGSLRVVSERGEGTRLVARLPLPPEAPGSDVVTPLRRSAA
jgi:two-component system sensor histidine kinase DesK